MRISDWSSDVCSSDLEFVGRDRAVAQRLEAVLHAGIVQRATRVAGLRIAAEDVDVAVLDPAAHTVRIGLGVEAHLVLHCSIADLERIEQRRERVEPGLAKSEAQTSEPQALMRMSHTV